MGQLTKGYYSPGYKWWWNEGTQKWHFCDTAEYNYLEIEAADVGLYLGRSIVANLFDQPSLVKCQFIARAWNREDMWVEGKAEFSKFVNVPFENLRWEEREDAQKQLNWLHQELVAKGWIPTEKGTFWYNYRYCQPGVLEATASKPDDRKYYIYLVNLYWRQVRKLEMKKRAETDALLQRNMEIAEEMMDILEARTAGLPKHKRTTPWQDPNDFAYTDPHKF